MIILGSLNPEWLFKWNHAFRNESAAHNGKPKLSDSNIALFRVPTHVSVFAQREEKNDESDRDTDISLPFSLSIFGFTLRKKADMGRHL